ncbi:integrase [Bicaudavirus pozzuoliense]|uniref:Putative integrase ORF241 n=2 Tax=Acidianus two-tailed virus TaxID=315953 RepID=Y241_ATV|nr:integrase [Acidianus two-tailed virus]Q3V4T7.1 RecName: Full=Putative integrase ORF241 [Acidianus two-tailed virus]AON96548.1 archaeal virus integrase [Acidianus two-tailed phage variant 1]CAI59877.1 putative integrase [Acidianus two-tailed virus]
MDKDELKEIIKNLPDNSPKILEYLKLAKEKGWKDIVNMIAQKLGLEEEEKKKTDETDVLKKILKPLGKGKIKGTWDYSVDFVEAKKTLVSAYKQLYDTNLMPYEAYVAILLIQLVNGCRIREAIRAFKTFIESGEREFQLQAQKHGNIRFMIIPDVVKKKATYNAVLTIDDEKLSARIRMFALHYLKANTHSLRYALISYLAKNGIDPAIIAKITGHKRLDRIITYTQTKDAIEMLRKLAD